MAYSPRYMYAEGKIKKEGGTRADIERFAKEYDQLILNYKKIIDQKGLTKRIDEVGLIDKISSEASAYNIDKIYQFYELIVTKSSDDDLLSTAAELLNIKKDSLYTLIEKVKVYVGDEFIQNVAQRQKYL